MKRTINAIVIHCSATPNGKDFDASDIDAMHKLRGFKRDSQAARNFNFDYKHIGYHFVIRVNGDIQSGRGIEEIGAHVQGSNAHSIGICMIGLDKFTEAQWNGLHDCMIFLAKKISGRTIATATSCITTLNDLGISVKGHRDYSPDLNGDGIIQRNEWIKDCPNFDVREWVRGGMVEIEEATL
jgi:N-acetyl-anhydromuramyl-L-alanine amidase AmpD